MEMMIDANIIIAIILNESTKPQIIAATSGISLVSTEILPYEIVNALSSMYRRKKLTKDEVIGACSRVSLIPIRLEKIDLENSLEIVCKYSVFAYDAYYLDLAQRLSLPLLTFDKTMKRVGRDMKLNMVEVKNADV